MKRLVTAGIGFATLLAVGSTRAALPDPRPPAVPIDATLGPYDDRDALTDLSAASGLPLEDYADSLDYDVSYDDAVAARYDDGYDPQAYTQFNAALAPYGTWIDDPAYGRIWVPSEAQVGDDFTPYATNGDWIDTEYGWTWSSAWVWGWAPFHYGRWVCLDRGWGWVPGTLWGPAWVSWRAGGGYVGWAPLPPRGVTLGSPIGARSPWRFIAAENLGRKRGAYLSPRLVPSAFGRTNVVSNTRLLPDGNSAVRVNAGPPAAPRHGGQAATPVHLANAAPRSLPRFAIQPRAGAPVADRPWVMAGATTQLPPYRRAHSLAEPGWGPSGYARGGDWSATPRGAGPGLPRGGFNPPGAETGAARVSSGAFFAPGLSSLPSSSSGRTGGGSSSTSPRYTAPTQRFTVSTPQFTAAPPLFTTPSSTGSSYARPSGASPFQGGSHTAGGRHH